MVVRRRWTTKTKRMQERGGSGVVWKPERTWETSCWADQDHFWGERRQGSAAARVQAWQAGFRSGATVDMSDWLLVADGCPGGAAAGLRQLCV